MKVVGHGTPKHWHVNHLPKAKWWQTHPEGVEPGDIVRCSCGELFMWRYFSDSRMYSWTVYREGDEY